MKLIFIDGPDKCGKTTLINYLLKKYNNLVLIDFPKKLSDNSIFKINTEKDFEITFTLYKFLDPTKIYIFDRGIVSNLVYDKILQNESILISKKYREKLSLEHNILEIFLTRDKIITEFKDDLIKIDKNRFNNIIDEYKKYGINYKILDNNTNIITSTYNNVITKIDNWICQEG